MKAPPIVVAVVTFEQGFVTWSRRDHHAEGLNFGIFLFLSGFSTGRLDFIVNQLILRWNIRQFSDTLLSPMHAPMVFKG